MIEKRGNCYAASEALYHILGGKAAGWKPMRLTMHSQFVKGHTESHWFLMHTSGIVLDPSVRQFLKPGWWLHPDYSKAVGCGFMTARPSKRARDLISRLTWTTVTVRCNLQRTRKSTRMSRGRRASAKA